MNNPVVQPYPCEHFALMLFDEEGRPRYLLVDGSEHYRLVPTSGRCHALRFGRQVWLTKHPIGGQDPAPEADPAA